MAYPFYIDLFAGVGGFRSAFDSVGGICLLTCEKDQFARETYAANHTINHPFPDDITKLDAADVPDHVLCGGFPCQPFSLAGDCLGYADIRGTLFFDICRIVAAKRPKVILLENVKNFVSHDKGRTLATAVSALENLGYQVSWRVISSVALVPQKRERVFILATLKGMPPVDLHDLDFGDPANGPKLKDILEQDVPEKYTLKDSSWAYLQAHKAAQAAKGRGFGYGLVNPGDIARTITAHYAKDGAEILVRQDGRNPRKLTPREAFRLMGFGDDFVIPVSDHQAYKQAGNSVVVPVVARIAQAIKAAL